ncbi:hypothetical protein VOLCADRAFT_87463 [Volvox carteri f. nagariensis]|uniref:Uncharacterized protein n=1 Tax=Volvox carteri f. nagariensis TaxID=3068 RepID=D8TLE4_VOLCA|nr:uncharacterized protein VOLCADRAFT_87463 [Volvox carteri f. nagariensis]EFJ51860.1 hypothetical protein VOLCADRAFT_87463 [Volvox carteri f. nagariensis]|eukprot:XP_002947270.1 hypothetical protein VOLCADRAFT_87463 [Volvox carteri f. nagariensis]
MASEYGDDADGGVAAEVTQRYGRSAQPESQQVVAVLQAVTDVIRNEGLPLSPTSYFAAIMSALEQPSTQGSHQVVLAMLTLLAVVMPRLPNHVLRARFVGCSELVGSLLAAHHGDAATTKAALGCLAQVLAAADPSAWIAAVPAFNQMLGFVADARPKVRKRAVEGLVETLASLQRSPALGAASELVLKGMWASLSFPWKTPFASPIAVCQRVLPGPAAAAHAAVAASNKQRAAAEEAITTAVADALHLIGALKGALPLLAPPTAKAVSDLLLKLYGLRQPLLDRHATEALAALAGASGPGGVASTRLQSAGELSHLISVVTDTESLWVGSGRDPGLLTALGRLLEAGFSKLAEADPAACAARLPRAVHALVPQLVAEQDGVRYGTFEALRGLISDCLNPQVVAAAKMPRGVGSGAAGGPTPLSSLVLAVAAALSARYQDAWGMALPVAGALVERLGELGVPDAAAPILECLGAIVAGAEDVAAAAAGADEGGADGGGEGRLGGPVDASHSRAAEATLGTAIRALGPEVVLQVLPLQILEGLTGTAEPRTWLLPLLRRHVRQARLGYWFKELLPLAQSLGGRAAALSAAGGAPAAALALKCRTLELQIWHCLPAFISWATDLPDVYGTVVNTLAAAFNNRPDLHPPICQALQRACAQVRHVLVADGRGPDLVGYADPAAHGPSGAAAGRGGGGGDDDDDDGGDGDAGEEPPVAAVHGGAPPPGYGAAEAEAALTALRAFNKQWLSVLCKAFLNSEPEVRGPYAAAISAMSAVTDAGVVGGYFRSALQKLSKIILDEAAPVPPADVVTDGGSDPTDRRNTFLELALWLSYGLPDTAVDVLFKAVKTAVSYDQASVQKRGFKVLAVLAEAREPWLRTNLAEVLKQHLLGTGATSTLSAARRYRLRLIRPVVVALQQPGVEVPSGILAAAAGGGGGEDQDMAGADDDDDDDDDDDGDGKRKRAKAASPLAQRRQLAASLIAEIVMCTKEANKKTRSAAYDLLVGLAHVMDEQDPGRITGSDDEGDDDAMEQDGGRGGKGGLYEFFTMVMAGLVASTPHMVSATVMALARLTYEFAAAMQNLVASLLPPVLSLLRGKAREVAKAVLGFVKVCAMRLPVDLLLPHLKPILEGMLVWAEDSKNKFKLKVRVIVERLARRCGFDAVAEAMPPSDAKLLAHIRKEAAKRQRRKHEGGGSEAGSEAGDDDRRSRRSGASSGRSSMARTARGSQWGHTAVFSSEEGGSDGGGGRGGGAKSTKSGGGRGGAASVATGRGGSGVRLASGSGDPMDLLDVGASRQLVRSAAGARNAGASARAGDDFKRDPASGKIVIKDDDEDGGDDDPLGLGRRGGKKRRRAGDADGYDSDDSDYDDLKGVADLKYALKKAGDSRSVRFAEAAKSLAGARSAAARSSGGRSSASAGGRSEGGRSSGAPGGGPRGRQDGKGGKGAHSGERFKAKNASGDVKGKAKVEPYAYWSLDRRMLNRRRGKQAAASSKLTSVISGAKAGAAKGAKAKRQAAAAREVKRQRTGPNDME